MGHAKRDVRLFRPVQRSILSPTCEAQKMFGVQRRFRSLPTKMSRQILLASLLGLEAKIVRF